jgi:hypothetical protein
VNYQERDILTDRADTALLRVIVRDPEQTWLFDMKQRNAWPHMVRTPELDQLVKAGDYKVTKPSVRAILGKAARAAALRKHGRFKVGFKKIRRLFTPNGRGCCFLDVKRDYARLTRRVFDRAVRQWLAGGRTPMAFAPRWDKGGTPAIDTDELKSITYGDAVRHVQDRALSIDPGESPLPEKTPTHTTTGQRRKRIAPQAPTLYRVDRMTLRVFLHFYEWKLKEVGRSIRQAYDEMCMKVFIGTNAAGQVYDLDLRQIPSRHTFEHWYFKIVDHRARRVGTRGELHFQQNEREELGDEVSKALVAGLIGSGDATIWNISVRSRLAGRRVVGCPVVFRIRCKRTAMLLGLAVILDSASWMGMATAIINCLDDKVAFCKKYGIDIRPEDWPVQGLMAILEVDRGETNNCHPTAFIEATGVEVENLKGQRPDLKSGSESDWRTLQVRLNGMTPGALIETWEKQQSAKWKLDGVMDIDQFTTLLLKHELAHMKSIREGVNLDDEMIAAGVVRSSLSMWNYQVKQKAGGLISFDRDEVALSLLPRKPATITEHGVYFQGCYYLCQELLAEHAFARARIKGHSEVKVAYDPRLVDCIHLVTLRGEELDTPFLCRLSMKLKHQTAYTGKCFEEIRELQQQDACNAASYAPTQHKVDLQAHRDHHQIVADARQQTEDEASTGESATAQVKGIPQARKEARFEHSPTQALTPRFGSEGTGQPATVVALPTPDIPDSDARQMAKDATPKVVTKSAYRDLLYRVTQQKGRTEP